MISFFYESVRKLKSKKNPFWRLAYKLNKGLINLLYPLTQMGNKSYGLDNGSHIIVSLTTYPARIDIVWITVASLLNQTRKPYKVILWLSGEQFEGVDLPRKLTRLRERGLEIRYCEDLKPHKKYFYTMQEHPDYYVVTADDDIFYPENHLEKLWEEHEKYPHAVICHWSHEIAFSKGEQFAPYNSWENNAEEQPSHLTLAVGCNGVLYPPKSLGKEAFDKNVIYKYALYTDDLWLKCMEIKQDVKVVNCNKVPLIYFNILAAQKTGLWKKNAGAGQKNDKVWEELLQQYPEVKRCLLKAQKEKGK